MTPLEMARLFSGFIMTTFLVWLTNFAEERGANISPLVTPKQETKQPEDPPVVHSAPQESPWNVSSFFGFKNA
jgi:hypothetical protein